MGKSEDHVEIELKMTGDAASLDALLHDALAQGYIVDSRERRVHTYYDTNDFDLFCNDLELRVRPAKANYRQTVKRLISLSEDSLFTRDERQSTQSEDLPDFKKLKKLLPKSLAAQKAKDLHPLMRTEFARRRFMMTFKSAEVECAVDDGQVVFLGWQGELAQPFRMLELELKGGDQADMMALAQDLQGHYDLTRLRLTKPEQAVRLGFDSEALPTKTARVAIALKLENRLGLAHHSAGV